MKIKTAQLSGAALDWAVAKSNGKEGDCEIHNGNLWYGRVTSGFTQYRPSSNWEQGGRIIEQNLIGIQNRASGWSAIMGSVFHDRSHPDEVHGSTPLIAAMRCYVSSRLGSEVDVPDELAN